MTVEELNSAIKSSRIPKLLFILGEEAYLAENRISSIRKKLVQKGTSEFNYTSSDGR